MYENTIELAENKLLLLYILRKIDYPISKTQLSEIVLENDLMNYFTLQQYLGELQASRFISDKKDNGKANIIISPNGERVLELFNKRISAFKLNIIDDYIDKQKEKIKKEKTIIADYTITDGNTYIVNLKALEGDYIIIDLKISVASKKQAKELCKKWKEKSSEIYNNIISTLI